MTRHQGTGAGEPAKRATAHTVGATVSVRAGRTARVAVAATAVLAAGALLAGCGGDGSGGANTSGPRQVDGSAAPAGQHKSTGSSAHSSTAHPDDQGTGEPDPSGSSSPSDGSSPSSSQDSDDGVVSACGTSELKVSVGPNHPGAGQMSVAVILTNRSGEACTVRGYPGVAFRDQLGQHTSVDPLRVNGSSPTVRLAPGNSAWASLSYPNPAQDQDLETVKPSTLVVTPPDERTPLMASWPSDPVISNANASQYWLPKIGPLHAGTGA